MNELPNGWVQITLGEAIQIQKGKKPIGLGPKGDDRSVPYINISAFEKKQADEYAPEQDMPRCAPSDTLLVWDGARAGLAGRGIGGFIGSTLALLTSDLADSAYLYYFVHSNYGYLNTHTKGVGIPHIDPNVLSEIEFPLPPATEQLHIVAKLEELLSDLDAGVAELKAAQKKLAKYRQSLLKAAVEGALTAEWRSKNTLTETGPQLLERILTERRARWEAKQLAKFKEQGKTPPKDWQKKYSEPVKLDATDLPALPAGWVWATIDQLSLEQRYGSSAKTGAGRDGVPVIRMGNIQDGELDFQDLKYLPVNHYEFPALFLADGDLLFNRTNSPELVGKTAVYRSQVVPCSYASYLIAVRFSEGFIPELAAAYINSGFGRQWIKSVATQQVGQANVNGTKLAALTIPLPPMNEQAEIVRLLQEQQKALLEQTANVEVSLKQSAAQRKNILKAAFSGQLVPQDPNDEPAGVLLARIRAERLEREKQPKVRKIKQQKEITAVVIKLIDVLAEAGDWVPAQEAFRRCGVADGAETDQIENLYAELRALDKAGRLAVETVTDTQGRKLHDRLKLVAG